MGTSHDLARAQVRHDAKTGRPYAFIDLGVDEDGRRIRRRESLADVAEEGWPAALADFERRAREDYTTGAAARLSVQLDRYLRYLAASGAAANTVDTYRRYAEHCLGPIRNKRVSDVSVRDINGLVARLRERGWRGQPLSAKTVDGLLGFLSGAWESFAREGLAESNVVRGVMRPRPEHVEALPLGEDALRTLNRWLSAEMAAEPDDARGIKRRCAAFAMFLALHTGARRGEICALRRRDVRTTTRTVAISGTVTEAGGRVARQEKTKGRKNRNVQVTQEVVDAVRGHVAWLDGVLPSHEDDTPLVTADGSWMRPGYLSEAFRQMRDETGLDRRYTFHSLRHTHASWLIQAGVDVRELQERLGHANAETTLRIYGHLIKGRDDHAAAVFQDVMRKVTG